MPSFNTTTISIKMATFTLYDYLMFKLMLLACAAIGLYYVLCYKLQRANELRKVENNRRNSVEIEYLVGDRKMKIFPIAMSLAASWISGISLLGIPTEIYLYGIGYFWIVIGIIIMGVVVHYIFLPVFIELRLTSVYAYLELRFDRKVRIFGSVCFFITILIWFPMVIYVPALAFNHATGINVHIITTITCVLCIIYTCIGGIHAVVWTDVFQVLVMIGTLVIIIVKSTIDSNGVHDILMKNFVHNRIQYPELSIDPTVRYSIVSVSIGAAFFWTQSMIVHQNMVQRYLCLSSVRAARITLWTFIGIVIVIISLSTVIGLIIYAKYFHFDPIAMNFIQTNDQLFPLFVMDEFKNAPGISGIFIAVIFNTAFGTLSSGLNSISAIVYEDVIKPYVKIPMTQSQENFILRAAVLIFGIAALLLIFLVEKLGTILQLSIGLTSLTNGPLLGVFLIGVLVPWIKANSVFIGGLVGLVVMSWITIKSQILVSLTSDAIITTGSVYNVSYLFYTCFGTLITILVALVASIGFGFDKSENINPNLVSPIIRKFVISQPGKSAPENDTIELAENIQLEHN